MKTILFLIALCSLVNGQSFKNAVAQIDTFGNVTGIKNAIYFIAPEPPPAAKKLALEWRGGFLFVDAANKFDAKFSDMNYSLGGAASFGYKVYGFRAEALAPLSTQGWSYRLKIEYQIF